MQGARVRELDPTGRNYDQVQLNKQTFKKKKENEVKPPSSGHTPNSIIL